VATGAKTGGVLLLSVSFGMGIWVIEQMAYLFQKATRLSCLFHWVAERRNQHHYEHASLFFTSVDSAASLA